MFVFNRHDSELWILNSSLYCAIGKRMCQGNFPSKRGGFKVAWIGTKHICNKHDLAWNVFAVTMLQTTRSCWIQTSIVCFCCLRALGNQYRDNSDGFLTRSVAITTLHVDLLNTLSFVRWSDAAWNAKTPSSLRSSNSCMPCLFNYAQSC